MTAEELVQHLIAYSETYDSDAHHWADISDHAPSSAERGIAYAKYRHLKGVSEGYATAAAWLRSSIDEGNIK